MGQASDFGAEAMQHAYPLDDLLDGPPEPSPEEVRAQVEDWLERLRALYAEIEAWAGANGWQVATTSQHCADGGCIACASRNNRCACASA